MAGVDTQQPDAALAQSAGAIHVDDAHRLATGKVTLEIAEYVLQIAAHIISGKMQFAGALRIAEHGHHPNTRS